MLKILIADDDPRMRQVIKDTVSGLANVILEASDGIEAIAVCEEHQPHWVLMDLRMKPMDGLRATAAIKASHPDTRIVMVSQYDDSELRAEAARVGACAYVLKENLLQLTEILGAESAVSENRKASPNPSHH